MNRAILLAAHGSSSPGARQSFTHIGLRVKENFPGLPVYWAFTSDKVRDRLAADGETFDSVSEALTAMDRAGLAEVAVQSLHVVPGEEYEGLAAAVAGFGSAAGCIRRLALGAPLLAGGADLKRAARAVMAGV